MKTKILINPDWSKDQVKAFGQKLRDNEGYCPCRLVKTPDTKCMCKEFRDQEEGVCHCGLHVKVKIEE